MSKPDWEKLKSKEWAIEWLYDNYAGFRYWRRPNGDWEYMLGEPIITEMLDAYASRLTAELEAANEKLAAARSVLELDRDSPCEWYVVGGCKVKNADGRGCNACRRREVLALLK
jgi:hypothetical protein